MRHPRLPAPMGGNRGRTWLERRGSVAYRPDMTEADWLTSTTLSLTMFRWVEGDLPSRKLQLLACAACRLTWPFDDPVLAETVEAVERHADGLLPDAEYLAARDHFLRRYPPFYNLGTGPLDVLAMGPAVLVAALISEDVQAGCDRVVTWVPELVAAIAGRRRLVQADCRRQLCDLIREVAGNPFRSWQPVPDFLGGGLVQPDGRTVPVSSAARGLAEGIAADLGFDRLPILADALEESGVTDAELLAHCRQPGGHVRGCWAVDVVLGR